MRRFLASAFFLIIVSGIIMQASEFPKIDIPYKKFVLKNGLTLMVHEDHKAPIVAVNIWYHVGSKNEKAGKTGFAHLFEHLMFNGSENFDDDYFQALERLGATDLNGTTSEDRTNYFQNVPTSGLDAVLWLESDRMGHLLKAVTQAKLDEQRGVVQNEKRQGENEPYSLAYELISKNTYPAGHPYSWTVIGSMEDLNAAKLEDVHEWFKTYYGPSNATLVVAGDITPEEAKAKVEKYFGDIPPGPPLTRPQYWVAKMAGERRDVAQDRVPQIKIMKVWNVPQRNAEETVYLDLLSDVLSSGKTSRLYKRLVYDEQIATNVSAYIDMRELSSQFYVEALVKQGESVEKVEKAINEEMQKLLTRGMTKTELEKIKTGYFAGFVRGIERIGGFGGKSDILAQNQVFAGNPEAYKKNLEIVKNATAEKIVSVGKEWLSDGCYVLEIHPYPDMEAATDSADRSKMPGMAAAPDAKFVPFEKRELSNGLKVIIANRTTIPVINFNLMINAGFAADQFALPGTANLTMDMLDEGTKTRDALKLNEDIALLGGNLRTGASLDFCNVSLSSLKNKLDESLEIFTDVLLNPSFPQKELDRLKKERMAQIRREKSSPVQMGMRAFPRILFGEGHAYGLPFSGTGYEETISKITVADLEKFKDTWFKPNNATLIIVGDITADEIVGKLEKLLKSWKKGTVPVKNIAEVKNAEKQKIY
ncbi:MAG: insulinase family protein, partial [Ignavibacteriales bacterium]|nr:insulinase family protein [Ignavibacteriales bacterium]